MDYKAAEHEEAAFVEPVRAENGIVQASYVDLGEPSISGSFPCTQQVLIPSTSSRSNLVSCSSQVSVSSSTAGSPRSLVRVLTSGRASRPRSAGRTGQLARAGGAFAAKAATAALSNNASAPVVARQARAHGSEMIVPRKCRLGVHHTRWTHHRGQTLHGVIAALMPQ